MLCLQKNLIIRLKLMSLKERLRITSIQGPAPSHIHVDNEPSGRVILLSRFNSMFSCFKMNILFTFKLLADCQRMQHNENQYYCPKNQLMIQKDITLITQVTLHHLMTFKYLHSYIIILCSEKVVEYP